MTDLKTVMLVEDDDDIAVLAMIALRDMGGLEVERCSNGPEALAQVGAIKPDLIILDYRMPHMNGDEVLLALRRAPESRDIPVLFMTASLMPQHTARLVELGALAVLPKPFDPLALAQQVRGIWEAQVEGQASHA
jgi:CheY-like chemotaxis protein